MAKTPPISIPITPEIQTKRFKVEKNFNHYNGRLQSYEKIRNQQKNIDIS
jgi:hypothetical protein